MEGVNDRIRVSYMKAEFFTTMPLCVAAHDCKWKDLLWDSGDNMRGLGLSKVEGWEMGKLSDS